MEISNTNDDIETSKKEIIARLKILRENHNLSQAKFANLIHVSPGNVGAWESGTALPGALALKNIALKLDCSIDWLIMGKEKVSPQVINDPELERLQIILQTMMERDKETRFWAKKQFEYSFKPFIEEEATKRKKQELHDIR